MNESAGDAASAGKLGERLPPDDGLDAAQRAAVRSPAAALLVVAGPGSGKTRVLTHRIAWRAATESMQARHAVAVTFTRRAAYELRTRLRALDIDDMGPVGTFHSIALAQVRQHDIDHNRAERKLLPHRSALSSDLAEHLRRTFGPRAPITVATALREIDWAKASDLSVAEYREGPARRRLGPAAGDAAAELFGHFERTRSRRRLLDFDDLLAECTRLMRSDEHFAAARRWLHRHFFVDEFQDLNRLQWNLLWEWLGGAEAVSNSSADICAVGDAGQAIYGWNGADSRYVAEFRQRFDGAHVVRLELNYRGHLSLVTAAQSILADTDQPTPDSRRRGQASTASDGTLADADGPHQTDVSGHRQRPARPHQTGPAPSVTAFDDAAAEAAGIARWIGDRHVGGVRWDSFGVLARTNAQLGDIAAALDARGIPHRLSGQRSTFLQLPAVQQMLEQLGAAGPRFAALVDDLRAEEPSGAAQLRLLDLAEIYLAEISSAAGRTSPPGGATGEGFANWLRLLASSDRELTADLLDSDGFDAPFDSRDGAVTLATFHAAKGLQWPHVVVAGVEDGLVPLRRNDPEERRLFYVAVSRASRTLHLTWARHRSSRSTAGERTPSPWLSLIADATAEPPPLPSDDAVSQVAAARAALDATRQPPS